MNPIEFKPSKTLNVLVWLAIIPSLIGEFFKVMHWPGAGPLMILGTFVFAFMYLPLYIIESWKTKETTKSKLMLISKGLVVHLFSLGFLFKIQHWPGAGILSLANNYLLFFVIVPFALYHLAKAGKTSLTQTHSILIVCYFFSHMLSALLNSGSGRVNIDTVLQQGLNTEEALRTASSRNKQLYATLNNIQIDENNAIKYKAKKVKTLTDSAVNHIKNLKAHLLISIDKIPKSKADSLSSIDIENKVNADITTMILIGNEFSPNKDIHSALKLKSVINTYRDSLLSLVQEQNRAIMKEGLNLSTDNYTSEDGEPVSWEMTNFNFMPLIYVYNLLTNIEYEIKNAEYQALTDIINSGNKELNTALFSQISELNSKYDAAKKQEEIAKLQTENERGMKLLNAKDMELSDSKQTIIYFTLIIMVFFLLVFFVIRSNYLRKQTNKTLLQQKEIIETQKTEVENQKHLVEEKQKEIIDSISYARRLQEAILPPREFLNTYVPDNFIYYKPKDLVAGDFYWAESIGDLFFIAAADSTGHGVPGAMVSVVCSNALNRTVKEFGLTETGKILDKTRDLVVQTFEKSTSEVKDGMDISLLCIDSKNKKITWSGANNPLWYISPLDGDVILKQIKADKQPIGKTDYPKPFTTHEIEYKTNTTFYLFTDGFADQFGGPDGKKFKYKQFSELLINNQTLSLPEQSDFLNGVFENWKKDLEQVDDVCVIGVRV
ncbi:MAG: protein serine/threonine phosphatase [Bacteroidetes bacterium]|jgi:serine phosphatase RsbU (regulator of sigma subunit)|nr:protein serine/threonine phosphatase [Bacteroidota bacterium]